MFETMIPELEIGINRASFNVGMEYGYAFAKEYSKPIGISLIVISGLFGFLNIYIVTHNPFCLPTAFSLGYLNSVLKYNI